MNQSRAVPIPGASHAVVLHQEICRAEVQPDQVRFFGLIRGETLVFVWAGERRVTLMVHVVPEPVNLSPPSLRSRADEGAGSGLVGASIESLSASGSPADYVLFHRVSWQQVINGNRLSIQGMGQEASTPGAPAFNLNTASVQYSAPHSIFSFVDTIVNVSGGVKGQAGPNAPASNIQLRGADIDLRRGINEVEFFAGSTVPVYFLDSTGTRDLLGVNLSREQSSRLYLYSTTALANAPLLKSDGGFERRSGAFQTIGATAHLNPQWTAQGVLGASTLGAMAETAVSYATPGASGWIRSGFGSVTRSSVNFPLNQFQLLTAGRFSATAGANAEFSSRLGAAIFYQHTSTQASALFAQQGSSDYVNPNLNFVISPRNRFTFNYTYTRSKGGLQLGHRSSGHRQGFVWSSQLSDRFGNSAELDLGSLSDPLHLNAQSQLSFRDSLNMRLLSRHTLFLSISHDRTDPSIESRLGHELELLSPPLQQLFRADPVAFVASSNLTPELRALLSNFQPSNTQVMLGGQFLIRERLNLSPNLGYFHAAHDLGARSNSHLLGYTLTYQITPGLQLQSSLSNLFLWDSTLHGLRRNTVLTVGFNKNLSGAPRWLSPSRGHRGTIRGAVFRDLNVNGQLNAGEPGMPDIRIELSDGQTAVTDSRGRYEFAGLSPGEYDVTLPLSQFKQAVRVTGPTSVRVDLTSQRFAEVDFGVVNFSRVTGNVYNDYRISQERAPDAPGIRNLRLTLLGGASPHEALSDGAGDFEFDDLPSGDYQLSVDRSTIPANFVGPEDAFSLHVEPASTVVLDVPLRALRSIAGKVFYKASGASASPQAAQVVSASASNRDRMDRMDKNRHEHEANARNRSSAKTPEASGQGPQQVAQAGDAAPALQPLAGIRLAVGAAVATTDAEGRFALRQLPAGEYHLTVLPAIPPPDGVRLPSWIVQLARDPVEVQDATIVISNPDLLRYLLPPPGEPRPTTTAKLGQ